MNCQFYGLLRPKTMARKVDLDSITGNISGNLPLLNVCITCYDTPSGCESENATHQKLID
jgi:hypothetical protein